MAYRRRYRRFRPRRSFRPYRRFKRYNMARRRYYRRGGRGRGGFGGISTNWLLGAAAGYFLPMGGTIDTLITAGAVAPIRIGAAKGICQGYVAAKVLKAFMGGSATAAVGGNSEVI